MEKKVFEEEIQVVGVEIVVKGGTIGR